jgi:hypothetical protein
MKNLSKTNFAPFLIILLLLSSTYSCVKTNPGPGGTSAITGKITGQEFKPGEAEIQQIIFTGGDQLEHGDYFLLNKLTGINDNYYIYFKNPNWVSAADPGLQGRIGIEVIFNYSDSNIEIAQAVKNKLSALNSPSVTYALYQDILTLTWSQVGNVADPDNGTTNFALDVANQGQADYVSSPVLNLAEQRVYLCYGDDNYPSEDVKTNQNGEFQFKNLQVGTYKVYVISEVISTPNAHQEVNKIVQITENESIQNVGALKIYY